MKKYYYSILGLMILILSSCDLNSESNYQPDIFFLQQPIANNTDTLNLYNQNKTNTISMDTIYEGDTVSFLLYLNGYMNKLTRLDLVQSADSNTSILLPNKQSMDSVFSNTSNYSQGKFLFSIETTNIYLPIRYIAKKASLDAKLTISISSDAQFEYNSNYIILKTPILATKE